MAKVKKYQSLESDTFNKLEEESTQEIFETPTQDEIISENSNKIEEASPLISLLIKDYDGFEDGFLEGFGKVFYTDGHVYEGTFINGQMEGKGTLVWPDGVTYEGDFKMNEMTGIGKYTWPNNNVYEGQVIGGKRNGEGKFTYADGSWYLGGWLNGKKHGIGQLKHGNEGYDGMWNDDLPHGYGIRKYNNGDCYQGYFIHGFRHGKGKMIWKTLKQTYFGDWKHNLMNGKGAHIWYLGNTQRKVTHNKYVGGFLAGLKSGFGIVYYADGAVFEGHFLNDKKNGKGKITFKNGRYFDGEFTDDQLLNISLVPADLVGEISQRVVDAKNPLPLINSDFNEKLSTISLYFNIPILEELLESVFNDKHVLKSILHVITRHLKILGEIFQSYGRLGLLDSQEGTFMCRRYQFWQLMKDCQFDSPVLSLADLTMAVYSESQDKEAIVDPWDEIIFQTFVSYIVILAQKIITHENLDPVKRVQLLIETKMIPNAFKSCKKGTIFKNQKTVENVFQHFEATSLIYKQDFLKNGSDFKTSRDFLIFIKNLNLFKSGFTAINVLSVMAEYDPFLVDSHNHYSLERTITFLEFFEFLVGFSEIYVTQEVLNQSMSSKMSEISLEIENLDKFQNLEIDVPKKEEVDEETEKFNFWTHQLHFFFMNVFYPATENFARIRKNARDL